VSKGSISSRRIPAASALFKITFASPYPFSWEIDASPHSHVRSITTDIGWKIDRGLAVFQWLDSRGVAVPMALDEWPK